MEKQLGFLSPIIAQNCEAFVKTPSFFEIGHQALFFYPPPRGVQDRSISAPSLSHNALFNDAPYSYTGALRATATRMRLTTRFGANVSVRGIQFRDESGQSFADRL